MRLAVEMVLSKEDFPTDFRPSIMSYFKDRLSKYLKGIYFDRYYAPGKIKPFCFAVWLGKVQFHGEGISIPSKRIVIHWSTDCLETGLIFYNAFAQEKHNWYPLSFGNSMRVRHIAIEKEEIISSNDIEVMFAAPLCIRKHDQETNRDQYYSYSREGFDKNLREVLENQLAHQKKLPIHLLQDFYLEPIRCKKTVVRHHGQFIEATLGTFHMHGDIRLLNHFYLAGIGSRSSAGYGYYNVIGQGGR